MVRAMTGEHDGRGRGWSWGRWVVAALAFFLLGTSRSLASKELSSDSAETPPGLAAVGPARAVLGENVNNQGCCNQQWTDLAFKVVLRNDGSTPVQLEQSVAEVLVDGAPHRMSPITYSVGGDVQVLPFEAYDLAPGEDREIRLLLTSFLPASAIRAVERIEVRWPCAAGDLVFRFQGVGAVATTTEGPRPSLWY